MNDINFDTMLRESGLTVPPLEIQVLASQRARGAETILEVVWRGRSYRFVAELRRNAKPLTLKMAIERVREYISKPEQGRPMIIAPYFSREKLDQLLDAGISAIDFSGNAAIEVPGEFLFYKTGNPNQYPDSSPIRSAYRGDGSLVARVLLLERQFQVLGGIREAISSRRGSLTMSMVSKVLQRLEADLVIERPNRNAVRVIQPERLLEGLLDAYQPPKMSNTWMGKVALPVSELLTRLQGIARNGGLVRTGEASAVEHAAWAGEPIVACYCRMSPATLLERLGAEAKETRTFANLRLIQTEDQLVYFDARPNLAASPIQAWLEMASGDKRQKEVAEQIRSAILSETGAAT
ncbi:MAG: hypothetical protein HC898_02895 [Phycisphaerales bacterium]|nr:hypothetical protein [Phycisphaerales bacterium]